LGVGSPHGASGVAMRAGPSTRLEVARALGPAGLSAPLGGWAPLSLSLVCMYYAVRCGVLDGCAREQRRRRVSIEL
jgi:hypothetical protein